MPLLDKLRATLGLEKRGLSLESPATPLMFPGAFQWLSAGDPTASGELINDSTAMQIVAVYSCVRIIAESIASLPMKLYERTGNGKIEAVDDPLYALLTVSPNPEMTAFSFWETYTGSLALTGNAYAELQRDDAGNCIALWPLNPRLTAPFRLPGNTLAYRTSDGMPNGAHRIIASPDMLHVPLLGDGILGMSPVAQARQALGLSRAAEKFGARFFGNGSRPGGILAGPDDLSELQVAQAKASWEASHGSSNSGKVAVMPGSWTYSAVGLSPEEGQFLQTRQFSREEVASLFRVPVHLLAETSKLSNNTATQLQLQFVTSCLRAYMSRIEAEVHRKLLPPVEGQLSPFFVQFDVREMLRGDFQQTLTALASGRQWGFYSINDCKAELGENPIGPEGDVYLVPLNMGNATDLLRPPAIETEDADSTASLGSYRSAFHRLFRDAVGKTIHRSKRDLPAISSTFQALLESIAQLTVENTRSRMDAPDFQHDSAKVIREYLAKLTERATAWTAEGADAIAVQELTKAVKALAFDATRAAAHYTVTKDLAADA